MGVSYKNGLVTPTWILSTVNCQLNVRLTEFLPPPLLRVHERKRRHAEYTSRHWANQVEPPPTNRQTHFNPPSPVKLAQTRFTNHNRHEMCYWYKHDYSCKHVTYALGRYCPAANLIQTPCKKRNIWQTIRMGEECEDCAMPEGRGNGARYDGVPEQQHKGGVKAKKGRKR